MTKELEQLADSFVWRSAEQHIHEAEELTTQEKELVLDYVRTVMEAVLANERLWLAIRGGTLGPDALTAMMSLQFNLIEELPVERV